jgi:hypothetical protein
VVGGEIPGVTNRISANNRRGLEITIPYSNLRWLTTYLKKPRKRERIGNKCPFLEDTERMALFNSHRPGRVDRIVASSEVKKKE